MTDTLRLEILRALAERGREGGYSRPEIAGYSREQIDAAVDELRQGRYVEAAHIPRAFGDNPAYWSPSVLTERGRTLLAELSGNSQKA